MYQKEHGVFQSVEERRSKAVTNAAARLVFLGKGFLRESLGGGRQLDATVDFGKFVHP